MAVAEVLGGEVAWFFEYDKAPSKILAHHWPEIPNYGDMTKADWAGIEQVDILCGGTPCQDLSGAGKRAGMTEGTRSNLWVQMREAIAVQRPSVVIWENVRGAYSACADSDMGRCPGCVGGTGEHRPFLRALGRVLGDLSSLGYDSRVVPLRGSDVGAAHGRYRLFVVAADQNDGRERAGGTWDWRSGFANLSGAVADFEGDSGWFGNRDNGTVFDTYGSRGEQGERTAVGGAALGHRTGVVDERSTRPADSAYAKPSSDRREQRPQLDGQSERPKLEAPHGRHDAGRDLATSPRLGYLTPDEQRRVDDYTALWDAVEDKHPYFISEEGKDYWPAILRHQEALGRPVPPPSIPDGKNGQHRYSPIFGEWMMMLPVGHVTAVENISRNDMHKALGNGVIPLQATTAIRIGIRSFVELAERVSS